MYICINRATPSFELSWKCFVLNCDPSVLVAHSYSALVRVELSRADPSQMKWHAIIRIALCSYKAHALTFRCVSIVLYYIRNPHFSRAHFNQFSSFLSFFHSLFVSPSNFLLHTIYGEKMFYDKMFRYCLHTAKRSFSLASRNVLIVCSGRLYYFASVCSGGKDEWVRCGDGERERERRK